MIRIGFIMGLLVLFSGCKNSEHSENPKNSDFEPIPEEERIALLNLGDSISTEMQEVLLGQVGKAIQKGGTDYAIEFCNIEAMPLTDSISNKHHVRIQRLSDKNRNPKNGLEKEMDKRAFEKIKTEKKAFIEQNDLGEVYYFKPIVMGMPTCIQCHGKKSDLSPSTLELIQTKYPEDKALDYELGDLRGMWKISM